MDWNRLGVPPAPLWEMPYEIATDIRHAMDTLGPSGPWLNAFRKSR